MGIGAVLEAKEVMRVLRMKENAPTDLIEKSLFVAGKVIDFDPKVKGGNGYTIAKEMLESGRALDAFEHIVEAQEKLQSADLGTFVREIKSSSSGEIKSVSNRILTHIAVTAGGSQYAGSGILLQKKTSDKVAKGDTLYKIYSNNSSDFALACSMAESANGYEIGKS